MSKSRAKSFSVGEAVEVQREARAVRPHWEPATYVKKHVDWKGWHQVMLPKGAERYIDSMTGSETDADNPRGFITHTLSIPTQRIRARKERP